MVITYNGNIVTCQSGAWVIPEQGPVVLPAYTLRLKYKPDVTPYVQKGTLTQVQGTADNIWDWTYENPNWERALSTQTRLLEVLGAGDTSGVATTNSMFNQCFNLTSVALFDTSSVTDMERMFDDCTYLTTVPLFDMSNVTKTVNMFRSCEHLTNVPLFDMSSVTNMSAMFEWCSSLTTLPLFNTSSVTNMGGICVECSSLTSVPLFDTSNVTNMQYAFYDCYNVESGALALYTQASTQANPIPSYGRCFYQCGRDTVTGAAELAQIPSDWK